MAKKLTELTEISVAPSGLDWLYLVDVSDLTDGADGTSKKISVANFLKGKVPENRLGAIVFNVSQTENPLPNQIYTGDWLIYMSQANNRILIGIAKALLTALPADLDDGAKFDKFYEGTKLL